MLLTVVLSPCILPHIALGTTWVPAWVFLYVLAVFESPMPLGVPSTMTATKGSLTFLYLTRYGTLNVGMGVR